MKLDDAAMDRIIADAGGAEPISRDHLRLALVYLGGKFRELSSKVGELEREVDDVISRHKDSHPEVG